MPREDVPEDWSKIRARIVRQQATILLGCLQRRFHSLVQIPGSDPVFAESPSEPDHRARNWHPLWGPAA
jgi:hypothetical protein